MNWIFIQRFLSPHSFYRIATQFIPWLTVLALFLFVYGLIGGLVLAPPDYQQGDAFRIIYIHVPCAFLSLFIYILMAFMAVIGLIWRVKLTDVIIAACAPLGACFTFLALLTGSIWGKPMWGTWWVWDARLTSELILLFLYAGIMALRAAIIEPDRAMRASGILLIIGVIDIPIIHYSVYWWNTLHQGDTLRVWGPSLISPSMLYPLLAMIVAFTCYFMAIMLWRAKTEIIWRERKSAWVQNLMLEEK